MHSRRADKPFIPVLYLADAPDWDLVDACRREDVGLIFGARGLKLLQEFRVRAILCGIEHAEPALAAARADTPVIVLASTGRSAAIPGATMLSSDMPVLDLAGAIREIATRSEATSVA